MLGGPYGVVHVAAGHGLTHKKMFDHIWSHYIFLISTSNFKFLVIYSAKFYKYDFSSDQKPISFVRTIFL